MEKHLAAGSPPARALLESPGIRAYLGEHNDLMTQSIIAAPHARPNGPPAKRAPRHDANTMISSQGAHLLRWRVRLPADQAGQPNTIDATFSGLGIILAAYIWSAVRCISVTSTLAELAGLIAAGELKLPIAATFPLDRVQDAYRRLAEGHVLGKIILLP
jgi:Zinc-binding dehydrogenase